MGLTWILFKQKNSWLLEELKAFVNESQSGRLEIGSMELNILGSFPDLEVLFHNVYYYRAAGDTIAIEPILRVDQVAVSLGIVSLLKEQVYISELSLAHGRVWLAKDSLGRINLIEALALPKKSPTVRKPSQPPQEPKPVKPTTNSPPASSQPSPAVVQIDLRQIEVEDFQILWHSFQSDTAQIFFQQLSAALNRSSDTLLASVYGEHDLQKIVLAKNAISPGEGSFSAEMKYDAKTKSLLLLESTLTQGGIEAAVQGHSNFTDEELEIQVDARVNDLEFLEPILQQRVLRENPNLLKRGQIFFRGKTFGNFDQLQMAATFGANDISWKVPGKQITFEDLGFSGQFESGTSPDFSQAKLTLRNIRGRLPDGSINGHFSITNFVTPYVSYNLKLKTNLSGYDEIFKLAAIRSLQGELDVQTKYSGQVNAIVKQDSSRTTRIECKNLSFQVNRTGQQITNLNAILETRRGSTYIQPLAFSYGKNQVEADLTFDQNLILFLLNRKSGLLASGHITAPVAYTQDFLFDTLQQAQVQDRLINLQFDFEAVIPADTALYPEKTLLELNVSNLSTRFDELTDIRLLNFKSKWSKTLRGLHVIVDDLQARFSHGEVNLSGELWANPKQWDVEADLTLNQFPWTYVGELAAEIQEEKEPKFKNLPVSEMDLVTGAGRVTASFVPYPFDIIRATVAANQILYQASGSKPIEAEGVNIQADPLTFTHPENSGAITGLLAGTGKAAISKLVLPAFTMRNVQSTLSGFNDTLQVDFACVTQKAKHEQGVMQVSMVNPVPSYSLTYQVEQADLKPFVQEHFHQQLMDGKIDYQVQLKSAGRDWASLKQTTFGTIEISSNDLVLHGIDVDNVLKKYEKSQNFNLTDVGAVLVAGPVGLAITKGTDFISLAAIKLDSVHHTRVDTLYARWSLDHLQLRTQDVAFATSLNRIAIQGQIDFLNNSIPGITIAVVDKKGCSLMDQKLSGKFSALETGKLNVTKTLFGSVINFVNAVAGVDCIPVYTGRVKHPQ